MATNNAWNNTVSNANVSFSGGTFTVASGTNAINISADAAATTVNVASGAGAKTVQIGSTNSSSSLALRYGTSDMTMASATGTVMSALDTGEINYPLQPAFLAYNSFPDANATGGGGVVTCQLDGEYFDQNGDFNTGTSTFTAPVAGIYQISGGIALTNISTADLSFLIFRSTNKDVICDIANPSAQADTGSNYSMVGAALIDMDAGDVLTLAITCSGQATTVTISGNPISPLTYLSGYLAC